MDLVLWRHAEALDEEDGISDLLRPLTSRGEKQAARVAAWLDRQLPEGARIIVSPALRCEQTAIHLGRKYKVREEIGPGASAKDILEAAQWPGARQPVLVVGHQPTLGEVVAKLLQLQQPSCAIRKGAAWWLRTRERDGQEQAVVVAVQSAETI